MVHVAPKCERGGVAVLVALLTVVMLVSAAFAIDLSHARADRTLADSAADAGATAGAQSLPDTAAAATAATAFANSTLDGGQTGTGATVTVTTPYSMTGNPYPPSRLVHVRVCWPSRTTFAGAFGLSSINVCGDATAYKVVSTPCGLCVLKSSGLTLSSTGDGALWVNGADIHVNSNGSPAAKITNPSSGGIKTDGTIRMDGSFDQAAPGQFAPTPVTGVPPIPDPLASLGVPSVAGPNQGSASVSGSSSVTLSPGIYDSITSSSSGQITLNPGIYVIKNKISLNKAPSAGNTSLKGNGVLLYFACSSYPTPCAGGESGADMSLSGGATYDLTAMSSGALAGVAIYYDRNSTSSLSLTGSSQSFLRGAIYMKSGSLSLTGSSGAFTLASAVIVGSVTKTGSSQINLTFDDAYAPSILGRSTILVE